MLSTYRNGFKTVGILPKDLHNVEKLHHIIEKIKDKENKVGTILKVFGVGVDYGANLLVKCAAEYPKDIQGLVSIANPLQLDAAEIKAESSSNWRKSIYQDLLNSRISRIKLSQP